MSRLNEMESMNLINRIARLKGAAIDLKLGRAYTSGKSGVIAYVIGNSSWDVVEAKIGSAAPIMTDTITFPNTGSMSSGNFIEITHTYTPKYQDFPIATPSLRVNVNGVDMVMAVDGGFPPWRATDGSTWGFGGTQWLEEQSTSFGTPKTIVWKTSLTYNGTATINMKLDLQIKSTDKGTYTTYVYVNQ